MKTKNACHFTSIEIAWLLLAAGLLLRLYGIWLPFHDSFAVRQTQVGIVARNYYLDGIQIMYPRIDIFGPSGGACILEFPLVPALASLLYKIFGEHEFLGRLVCVGFSMGALWLLYMTAKRLLGKEVALYSLTLASFSPLDIYLGRSFQGESSMMFFSLAGLYLFLRWLDGGPSILYFISALSAAMALVTKPTAAVILVPIAAAWLHKEGWAALKRIWPWWYCILATVPLVAWSAWARYVNSMNPDLPHSWGDWTAIITKYGNVVMLWMGAHFYTKVGFSVAGVILTPLGFVGAVVGLFLIRPGEGRVVLHSWVAAVVASIYALAGANAGHPYYQMPILPGAAMLFGVAASRFVHSDLLRRWNATPGLRLLLYLTAVILSVGYCAGYWVFFNYMYDIKLRMPYAQEISKIIRDKTPKDAVLIIHDPTRTTIVLTYHSRRPSWAFDMVKGERAVRNLEEFRFKGGTIFVSTDTSYGSGMDQLKGNTQLWEHLNDHYVALAVTEHYAIFDLTRPREQKIVW